MTMTSPGLDALDPIHEGILPREPRPFFLPNGEGEKSLVFDQLFTILLTGEETEGQYGAFTMEGNKGDRIPAHRHPTTHEIFYVVDGEITLWLDDRAAFHERRTLVTGDFAFIPADVVHAFQIQSTTKVFGVGTGGFERFFHAMGQPTAEPGLEGKGVFVPDFPQMRAAGEKYGTVFMPEFVFQD